MDYMLLYIGTGLVVFLSIVVILLVVWNIKTINRLRTFAANRDSIYSLRIGELEILMKTEFKKMAELLKPNK